MKYPKSFCFVAFAVFAVGCLRGDDDQLVKNQDQIARNALSTVPLLRSFKNQYPKSQNFISYITGADGQTTWNSKAALYGRYVLQMSVPVRINSGPLNVQLVGTPSFEIREVTAISTLPDGRQEILYGDTVKINLTDWKKLQAANGDFNAIGVKLKKNKPVKGFGDYSKY
jgi:hypothetical protein